MEKNNYQPSVFDYIQQFGYNQQVGALAFHYLANQAERHRLAAFEQKEIGEPEVDVCEPRRSCTGRRFQ